MNASEKSECLLKFAGLDAEHCGTASAESASWACDVDPKCAESLKTFEFRNGLALAVPSVGTPAQKQEAINEYVCQAAEFSDGLLCRIRCGKEACDAKQK